MHALIYVACVVLRFFLLMRFIYDDNAGYLFEGHLTVDPEPPQPAWLVQSNLLTAAATLFNGESSAMQPNSNSADGSANLLEELLDRLNNIVPEVCCDLIV